MSDVPNNDEVICPACCHQFRAIPVNVQQEIERLRAELAQREAYIHMAHKRDGDEIERLRAELAACREDAERYRWLKNRVGEGPLMKMACSYSHSSKTNFSTPLAVLEARTADSAIDAARKP